MANFFNGTITRFTPGGVPSLFASGLSGPNLMSFDRHGNLYVADYFGGYVSKITPDGVATIVASGWLQIRPQEPKLLSWFLDQLSTIMSLLALLAEKPMPIMSGAMTVKRSVSVGQIGAQSKVLNG